MPIRVELMGLPTSGKSSIGNFLKLHTEFDIKVFDEFEYKDLYRNANLNNPELFIHKFERRKLKIFLSSLKSRSGIIVIDRGPNDSLAYLHFAKILIGKQPKSKQNILRIYKNLYLKAQKLTGKIDIIILFKISLRSAQERRLEQGLSKNGKMVNESYFPLLSKAYRHWLKYIYPKFKIKPSLLVINGEESRVVVQKKVLKFIELAKKLKKS